MQSITYQEKVAIGKYVFNYLMYFHNIMMPLKQVAVGATAKSLRIRRQKFIKNCRLDTPTT